MKLTKTDPTLSARNFQRLCKGCIGYVNSFDSKRQRDDADGFFAKQGTRLVGMALFTPFHKDDYPPPCTKDGCLDKADPIFFSAEREKEKKNITENIYRGYDLHILCADKNVGRLLLARVLFEIRKFHGRVITGIVGTKEIVNSVTLYKEFGFDFVEARFPIRYGGQTWKTQITENDMVEEPTWMTLMVTSSKDLITLKSVRNLF